MRSIVQKPTDSLIRLGFKEALILIYDKMCEKRIDNITYNWKVSTWWPTTGKVATRNIKCYVYKTLRETDNKRPRCRCPRLQGSVSVQSKKLLIKFWKLLLLLIQDSLWVKDILVKACVSMQYCTATKCALNMEDV